VFALDSARSPRHTLHFAHLHVHKKPPCQVHPLSLRLFARATLFCAVKLCRIINCQLIFECILLAEPAAALQKCTPLTNLEPSIFLSRLKIFQAPKWIITCQPITIYLSHYRKNIAPGLISIHGDIALLSTGLCFAGWPFGAHRKINENGVCALNLCCYFVCEPDK
jgi:hypothetical protein